MHRKVVCWLLLATAGSAFAAAPKRAPEYSSREEYRACLEEKDQIDTSRTEYETRLAQYDGQVKQFEADAKSHATNMNSQVAVNRSDERGAALTKRSIELNAAGQGIASAGQDFEAKIAAHNQRCAGMVVRMQDREAVHKERARLGKKS